jgi:hypothetical protein
VAETDARVAGCWAAALPQLDSVDTWAAVRAAADPATAVGPSTAQPRSPHSEQAQRVQPPALARSGRQSGYGRSAPLPLDPPLPHPLQAAAAAAAPQPGHATAAAAPSAAAAAQPAAQPAAPAVPAKVSSSLPLRAAIQQMQASTLQGAGRGGSLQHALARMI